jgi:hypothetical protein
MLKSEGTKPLMDSSASGRLEVKRDLSGSWRAKIGFYFIAKCVTCQVYGKRKHGFEMGGSWKAGGKMFD